MLPITLMLPIILICRNCCMPQMFLSPTILFYVGFSLTRRPCFLYATDLNYYDLDRGFYSDIHTWPYPLAESNSALIKNIKQFNNDQYQKNIQKHWDALGSYESGHACETVANYILTSNT